MTIGTSIFFLVLIVGGLLWTLRLRSLRGDPGKSIIKKSSKKDQYNSDSDNEV